jgi:DNA repair protein SbcD/Mre11
MNVRVECYDTFVTLRFLHAADLHLDSPMKGLRESASHLDSAFAQCTNLAFEKMIQLAIDSNVEAVLLAGDLYDRKDRSLKARFVLRDGLMRLHEAKIKTFIVHGNHDPLSGADEHLLLPPSVTVFSGSWNHVKVTSQTGIEYVVQGISYLQSEVTQNLSAHYHRVGDVPNIGILHANVGNDAWHSNYSACTPDDLSAADLDYWALGHVHTQKTFELQNGVAAYSGNLQSRHRGEMGIKGCVLVELDETRVKRAQVKHVSCDVLRWHVIEVDIATLSNLDELISELESRSRNALAQSGLKHGVIGVHLVGAGAVAGALKRADAKSAFEERLERQLSDVGLLLERVDYNCLPQAGPFSGLLNEALVQVHQEPDDALWAKAKLEDLDVMLSQLGLPPLNRAQLIFRAQARLLAELAGP